jgi:hypothetical protein
MISGRDDHYFGDLKALIGRNKCRYREFFVDGRSIFCKGKQNNSIRDDRQSEKTIQFYLGV